MAWRRLLRRRWRVGAALFAVVFGLGAALVLLSRPVHRAESKLRLGEPPPMGGVSPSGGFFGLFRLGGDPFANDLELLSSRTLAEGVVDDNALNVRLVAPRGWHRDSLITELSADRTTRRGAWSIEWLEDGAIEVRPDSGDERALRASPGEPVAFGGVHAVFQPWRPAMPRRIQVTTISHAEAARITGGRIAMERTRRDANVVAIRYDDPDPGLAHRVVWSVLERFVAFRTAIQRRESGETVDSLRTIVDQTRDELAAAERSVEQLQRRTGLVAPEAQSEAVIEQYTDAGARLELARMELSALDAALGRASEVSSPAETWSALLAYPRFLENETLAGLVEQLTTLEQERRELAQRRTADNLEHRAVLERMEYLDTSLRALVADYRSALALQLAALESQVAGMEAQLAEVPAQAIELARRQRDTRVLAEIVILTEQRLRQEQLRQALTFANVQVIDPPALRDRPVWPRRKLGLLVAFMLAGGTALLGMVTVDRADGSVRRAADVRGALDVPVLAVLRRWGSRPYVPTPAELSTLVRRGSIEAPGRARIALAPVDDAALARLVADAIRAGAEQGAPDLAEPELTLLEPIGSFAAAAAAAAERAPIVLLARAGSTRLAALRRAGGLVAEAGAEVAGVVLVCDRRRDFAEVWS